MDVATSRVEVGIRDLKNHLSRYIEAAKDGKEVVVTDRGRPVARLLAVDASTDRLAELVDQGLVRPAAATARTRPEPVSTAGTVSDLVAEQRR